MYEWQDEEEDLLDSIKKKYIGGYRYRVGTKNHRSILPKSRRNRKKPAPAGSGGCANCCVKVTSMCRRGEGMSMLCNACGIYWRKHGTHRIIETLTRGPHAVANRERDSTLIKYGTKDNKQMFEAIKKQVAVQQAIKLQQKVKKKVEPRGRPKGSKKKKETPRGQKKGMTFTNGYNKKISISKKITRKYMSTSDDSASDSDSDSKIVFNNNLKTSSSSSSSSNSNSTNNNNTANNNSIIKKENDMNDNLDTDMNKPIEIDNLNYICEFCKDGGELFYCDKCPRGYHINCYDNLKEIPKGEFICVFCQNVAINNNSSSNNNNNNNSNHNDNSNTYNKKRKIQKNNNDINNKKSKFMTTNLIRYGQLHL